ncbi:hypothetical protein PG994_001495 [Apiospora phragmitis]|uniref:Uncharacterized protein n=1 Tax=Apiospora phragmitis TaxID=2905665 RepID=A0ABR1WTN9_9PEZI
MTDIWSLLAEKQVKLAWWTLAEAFQMAARKLRNCKSAFHDAPVVENHRRDVLSNGTYTDGSVHKILACIEDIGAEDSTTAERARKILERVAADVGEMVTSRLDSLDFRFESRFW